MHFAFHLSHNCLLQQDDRIYYSSPHVIVLQPLCEQQISLVNCSERVICQMLDKRRKLQKAFRKSLKFIKAFFQTQRSDHTGCQ